MKDKKQNDIIPADFKPLGMTINPFGPVVTDPQGSYTGRPAEPDETPVQDADDL